MKPKIAIVGAGPGGLTAGMILSHRGFDVEIYEKNSQVGGRNGVIEGKGFKFDIGPTFLMMPFVLEDTFKDAGKNIKDYLRMVDLEPMYRLKFDDKTLDISSDYKTMKENFYKAFPDEDGFDKFLKREKKRYEKLYPCLLKPYTRFGTFFEKEFVRAIPHFSLPRSMYGVLGNYFKGDKARISFTFQSKYLGMSPWECPAAFLMIPYVEHAFGIKHVIGGLSEISVAMAKVVKENGGKIYLNKKVKKLILEGRDVKGVELEDGKKVFADKVVINADFGYAMSELVQSGVLKKYNSKGLSKRKFSCSTFMVYLGIKKLYNLPHHQIIFSKDYKKYIKSVFDGEVNEDISLYVRNASITDKTIAPKGKSALYVLVPVPNQRSGIDWKKNSKIYRDRVISMLKSRAGMEDIEKNIVYEKVLTPNDWEKDMNVFVGATFNLSHNLKQMLYFRPRNKFEELENCYLVGGGTHPGSGLPTIYESGRITANMICSEK